ncbi:MAG: tetratricopeptide repeat protein [Pseudohongiella sp.]|nr:tetratricopeptide repeat protein [Pseudohongiella sp.]
MKTLPIRLLLLVSPLLVACAGISAPQDDSSLPDLPPSESEVAALEVAALKEEIEYGNFTREQLEIALLSEFGGMRGYLPQAAEGYYELALETRDLSIIKRAVEFVSATANTEALAELASLWLEKEPDALQPHLVLGYQLMEQGLYIRALPHLNTVMDQGGQVDFTALSARTFALENRQREVLITELEGILDRHPEEPTLYYALSQMNDQSGQSESAAEWLQIARARFGDNSRTYLIEAQLLQNMGRAEDAEVVLANAVQQYQNNRLLRYSYAQLLVQNGKLAEAAAEFEMLIAREPQDMETLYSLVLINLELEDYSKAEPQLRALINARHRLNEAHYYLAIILESRNDLAEALTHYQQISRQSNAFLASQRQIMRIMVQLQQFDEAGEWSQQLAASDQRLAPIIPALEAEALVNQGLEERASIVLDRALTQFPDNIDLLFARALLSERLDNLEMLERDLRQIIALSPEDARALNHLGYALTIRTNRYQEALDLIERAIAISPDDPAIIDSLGWVQYKLGMLEQSIVNLRRAYAAFPDHEVAAHLGEVLWVNGQQAEALQVWQSALESFPDSEIVTEAMERLMPQAGDQRAVSIRDIRQ